MSNDYDLARPLLDYIRRESEGCEVPLTKVLEYWTLMGDSEIHSSFWFYRTWVVDGYVGETLCQLLFGRVEPDSHYYWTVFNFENGTTSEWSCWGSEPAFYVVYDDADEDGR